MDIERRHELWLLYSILDKLHPDQGWERSAEIVRKGFEPEYSDLTVHFHEPVTKRDADFLHAMFARLEALQDSITALGLDDASLRHSATFIGFDFNDSYERQLAGYAEFLFNDGRWTSQRPDHGLNSHSLRVDRYREIILRFASYDPTRDYRKEPLSETEIRDILG